MKLYRKIRMAGRDGMSAGAAACRFGISRESVKKMHEFSIPPGYQGTAPVPSTRLRSVRLLPTDIAQPSCQRHNVGENVN